MFAKKQNKINIRKDVKKKKKHVRKLSPNRCSSSDSNPPNSQNKNERLGHHKLIKSINKAGKQVVDTHLNRVFLN